jgi:hypothetical protein
MLRIFTVITLLALTTSAQALEKRSSKPTGALGVNMGWVEANGLSYRKYFGNQYLQMSFAGSYDKTKGEEYFDASISYARYLNIFDLENKYLPLGFKFVTGIEAERDADRRNDIVDSDNKEAANELHIGAGFGVDIGNPLQRGLSMSFNAIYTASYSDFEELEFVRLGLLPSVGLHYAF